MYFTEERIRRILDELQSYIYPDSIPIEKYKMKKGNFTGGEKPDLDTGDWADFYPSDRWGGKEEEDRHYWFRTEITIPQQFDGRMVIYHVKTAEAGRWDLANPQLLAYVNGNPTQGMDVRHQEIGIGRSRQLQRLGGVDGPGGVEAAPLEGVDDERTHQRVVLHDQHSPPPRVRHSHRITRRRDRSGGPRHPSSGPLPRAIGLRTSVP